MDALAEATGDSSVDSAGDSTSDGGMDSSDAANETTMPCEIPGDGGTCNGVVFNCGATSCGGGSVCCLTITNQMIAGSSCMGACSDFHLQLCATNGMCSGLGGCVAKTCGATVFHTCGGVPMAVCK